jgi:DNA polymerase I-like protein with 3'-5' exonuclease and polymerase domains
MNSVQRKAERDGWVKGFMGRIRRLPDAQLEVPAWKRDTPEAKRKVHAKLAASNFPIQNLGSELNAWAFARATLEIQAAGMKAVPLGATHDSMTFDAPAHEVQAVVRIGQRWMVQEIAKRFDWIGVPLAADPEAGPSWGEMSPVTLAEAQPVQ